MEREGKGMEREGEVKEMEKAKGRRREVRGTKRERKERGGFAGPMSNCFLRAWRHRPRGHAKVTRKSRIQAQAWAQVTAQSSVEQPNEMTQCRVLAIP